MAEYESCFVGIPLPDHLTANFRQLQMGVKQIYPLIDIGSRKIPHITTYYLGSQSESELDKIAQLIKPEVGLLRGKSLCVTGLGCFNQDKPSVLFLGVKFPEALERFDEATRESLNAFYPVDRNRPFAPQMTVGILRSNQARKTVKLDEVRLTALFERIKWEFPVSEVALFGIDATQSLRRQKKLISL